MQEFLKGWPIVVDVICIMAQNTELYPSSYLVKEPHETKENYHRFLNGVRVLPDLPYQVI